MSERLQLPADISMLTKIDVSGEWKHFWEGTQQGKLWIQECPECGHRQFYPRNICTACGASPDWLEASGRGTLYTFSIVRQYLLPPFKDMLPYVTAMVDLEEGVRMLTNLVDCDLEAVKIGMPLQVKFVKARDDLTVPYWRPAEG